MSRKKVAVIKGELEGILSLVKDFKEIVEFVFIGDKDKYEQLAADIGIPLESFKIINELNDRKAAALGAQMASDGEVDVLMKGLLHTGTFIKAILRRDLGMLKDDATLISLVSRFEMPGHNKPIFITDPGINIEPNIDQKAAIIRNAISVAHSLGVKIPKVACISPVEVVNKNIQSSVDGAILSSEYSFENAIVEGPISFDISVSKEAAEIKGHNTPVSGDADILMFPEINSGNAVYKSLSFFGKGKVSGIVAGLKIPVVLTSRADSIKAKSRSLMLALETLD